MTWNSAELQLEIQASDTDNDANNNDKYNDNLPHYNEVDDDYTRSCFDRYDNDDTTGLHGCKDVLQVSDLLDCESASTPQSSSNELCGTAPLAPEQVPL